MVENWPANAGDVCSIPELGRSPGERNGNPLQCSCLENPMDWGAWQATVCSAMKNWTWLTNTFTLNFLEQRENFLCVMPTFMLFLEQEEGLLWIHLASAEHLGKFPLSLVSDHWVRSEFSSQRKQGCWTQCWSSDHSVICGRKPLPPSGLSGCLSLLPCLGDFSYFKWNLHLNTTFYFSH